MTADCKGSNRNYGKHIVHTNHHETEQRKECGVGSGQLNAVPYQPVTVGDFLCDFGLWVVSELNHSQPLGFRWPQRVIATTLVGLVTSLLAFYVYSQQLSSLLHSLILSSRTRSSRCRSRQEFLAQKYIVTAKPDSPNATNAGEHIDGLNAEYCQDVFKNVTRFESDYQAWLRNQSGTAPPSVPGDGSWTSWEEGVEGENPNMVIDHLQQ